MDYTVLGRNIAQKRIKSNMTQEQLAEKTDVSTVFISQIETSVRKPSLETIYKISLALNTTIDALIGTNNIRAKYDEILKILNGKSTVELEFIAVILKEICANLKDGQISIQ